MEIPTSEERAELPAGDDQELVTLARKLGAVRRWKDELTQKLQDAKDEENMVKGRLKELLDRREMTRFHVDGVGLVYSQSVFYPKVVGDPTAVLAWLDAHEGGDVAPRTVKRDRFQEYYTERLQNDQEVPPPDLVEVATTQEVRFRPDPRAAQEG